MYGIYKDSTDEPIYRAARERDTGNRLVDAAGEGEGGTNRENSMETYITICKIDREWKFAV